MDIVFIADFCDSFDPKDNSRFLYIINLLKDKHNIELISSDYDHGKKKYFPETPKVDGYKLTLLHEAAYPKNVCLRRFWGHMVWAKNVKKYLKDRKKPDVVYCAMPTLLASKYAGEYCKKNKIRFITDIQDLWPEAFQMVFNIPVLSNICFSPFKYIANKAYSCSDEIIAVSRTYVDRALSVNDKCSEGKAIFLGTNLDDFDRNVKENPIIEKSENDIWIGLYGDNVITNNFSIILESLHIIEERGGLLPKFIIFGEHKKEKEAEDNIRSSNILFTDRLHYQKMCGILAACDTVIDTSIENYGIECDIENSTLEDVASAVEKLCNDSILHKKKDENATLTASMLYGFVKSYSNISELIVDNVQDATKQLENSIDYFIPVKNKSEYWLGYCGSLSNSYDIKMVIDALALLNRPDLCFIVMGNGILKDEFQKYAIQKKVNALFCGSLPYNKMCAILKSCDIVINPIMGNSAASIINKHADYAAVGLPVINTQESSEYRDLVDNYHMGFNCKNGDAPEVASKISYLLEHPNEAFQMGINARKCAEEKFDRKNTYKEIINSILKEKKCEQK